MLNFLKNLFSRKDAGIKSLNNVVGQFESLVTKAEQAQSQIDAEIAKTHEQVQVLIERGNDLYSHARRAANVAKNIRSLIN